MSVAFYRRTQLTLFVPAPWRERLDSLRRALDPVQAALIGAHVTLCREEEIEGHEPEAFFDQVLAWHSDRVRLEFDLPRRFSGHGVLLPCVRGSEPFQQLRRWLLRDQNVRIHDAHLTLAHPRNPRSPQNIDDALASFPRGLCLEFPSVALIEQRHGCPWQVLREEPLGGATRGA